MLEHFNSWPGAVLERFGGRRYTLDSSGMYMCVCVCVYMYVCVYLPFINFSSKINEKIMVGEDRGCYQFPEILQEI